MSLFKTKEWWSYTPDSPKEPHSPKGLVVASFGGVGASHSSVIVTGSLSGTVRIFDPTLGQNSVLLEAKLPNPVLELEVGQFSRYCGLSRFFIAIFGMFFCFSNGENHLAVLHPRLLSVYSIQKGKSQSTVAAGVNEQDDSKQMHIDSFQLILLYEHKLSRSAFSVTAGHFGRVLNKDFLCVQSIDGTISVFEQESHAFSRFLPGFLIPSPLVYVQRTDSLVTVSSAFQVESYRYKIHISLRNIV